jgi:hypothetical protein
MGDVTADTGLAKVVHVVDSDHARGSLQMVINQGALHGVKVGDRFLVFGNGPHIADPDTVTDLGILELVRGQGEVVHVQHHMASIRSTDRRRTRPAKRVIRDSTTRTALALGMIPTGVALGVVPDPAPRAALGLGAISPTSFIEEELSPETEIPFDSLQLGDLAKPI